ncbi:MAG: AMIN domain-containing protein, partial [Myxococcota bacterium]|nr:AMIN domain-containing protein [Myxococcota bacterium]
MGKTRPSRRARTMRYAVPFLLTLLALSARADDRSVNRLKTLKVNEQANATVVVIEGSAPPTFTVFKLDKPTRLFIDVSNADITSIEGPITVENGVINDITPLQFTDELVQIGRIVVGLETDALYSVKADSNKLVITVDASQRRSRDVAERPDNSGEIAAAQSRAADAETRAKQAEQRAIEAEKRALAAEEKARSTAKTAEKQVAKAQAEARTAEATARAAEAKALRAAEVAREQAERAANKASDAEIRALKLAQ